MTVSATLPQHLASPHFCRNTTISIIGLILLAVVPTAFGQEALLDRQLGDGYQYLGQIQPRHARDIVGSNWSVGAETMDRDYTIYKNWKEYLGPLGAKKARVQSGWAKTEKKQGEYDWAWVDEVVLDMVQQGVEPWVCLCYGNPIYPGGGDTGLGGGLVASEEALQAWERYVAAFVQRYSKYVDEWELWNEPRTGRGKGTVQYGQFVIRTATVIRGKGDQAIWSSDKSVSRAQAGQMISRAIAEQWEIVRSIDPRPLPPATTTLWLEGSQLMSEGSLTFPKDITIVFCDEGESQKMQQDFHQAVRSDEVGYGAYYHIGFWSSGPHLLQGSVPRRIRHEFSQIVDKGDTDYAIINVCNVREHVLGIQAATELMSDFTSWSEEGFWWRFAPEVLHQPYRVLLGNLIPLNSERIMQDGALFRATKKMLASYCQGRQNHGVLGADTATTRQRQLTEAIAALDGEIFTYPADQLSPTQRTFYDIHLLTQTKMWRELYAFYLAVIQATDDPQQLSEAETALERFLQVRQAAEGGKWADWYRGDKKVNVPALLKQTREAKQRLLGPSVAS